MICFGCGVYMDPKRNHIWRLELRDVIPGKDDAHLMLGAALCQDCAMDVARVVKDGNTRRCYQEVEENND